MKIKLLLTISLLVSTVAYAAKSTTDEPYHFKFDTRTEYIDKSYHTHTHFVVDATNERVNHVMAKFIYDLENDPYSLFNNILKGLGTIKDDEDSSSKFDIDIKSCTYDSTKKVYVGVLDFYVGKASIKNIKLYGRILRTRTADNHIHTYKFELLPNSVAKKAQGVFVVKEVGDCKMRVELTADFQFSWFLNIFFSTKNYKNVAEWRIDKLMENLQEEIRKEP